MTKYQRVVCCNMWCVSALVVKMDAQWQNFWIESINKEAAVRFQWHLRYSKQFAKTAFQSRPKKEGMKFGGEIGHRIRLLEEQGEQTKKSASQPLPSRMQPMTPPQVGVSDCLVCQCGRT